MSKYELINECTPKKKKEKRRANWVGGCHPTPGTVKDYHPSKLSYENEKEKKIINHQFGTTVLGMDLVTLELLPANDISTL